jgi:hypothetical protein
MPAPQGFLVRQLAAQLLLGSIPARHWTIVVVAPQRFQRMMRKNFVLSMTYAKKVHPVVSGGSPVNAAMCRYD